MTKKKLIKRQLGYLGLETFSGEIGTRIKYLENIRDAFLEKGYEDIALEVSEDWDIDDGYYGGYRVIGYSYETDAEVAARIKRAAASRKANAAKKQKQLAQDRATYLRLKAKLKREGLEV